MPSIVPLVVEFTRKFDSFHAHRMLAWMSNLEELKTGDHDHGS